MSVTIALEIQVQPGKADAVKEFLQKNLPDTRAYAGFESLSVHQNQDDPNSFVIWEQWATRPNYEAYLAWRDETGVLQGFVDMLAGPPSFKFYDFVGA